MRSITRDVLAGVALLLSSLTTAQAAPAAADELIDLDFPGGTAAEYIEAVRKAAGETNIVVRSEVDAVLMGSVQLRSVNLNAALTVLEGLTAELENRTFTLTLDSFTGGSPSRSGGSPVYMINTRISGEKLSQEKIETPFPQVWSLKDLVSDGTPAEDILTAIETALELVESEAAPVKIRYHNETSLLIAHGYRNQMNAIEGVIIALASVRPNDEHEQALAQYEMALVQAQRDAEAHVAAARNQFTAELVQADTRTALYRDELESLRMQNEQLRQEMHQMQMQYEVQISRFTAMLDELKAKNGDK